MENRIQWQDPTGKQRIWESCERPTRPKESDIDAVGIAAILEKSTGESPKVNWMGRERLQKKVLGILVGFNIGNTKYVYV